MEIKICTVGKIAKELDGKKRTLVCPDGGGNNNGYYFMDTDAFKEKSGEICYIPEHAFDDLDVVADKIPEEWYDVQQLLNDGEAYTYADFLRIAGTERRAACLFEGVDWQHPEALMGEYDRDKIWDAEDRLSTGEIVCYKDVSGLQLAVFICYLDSPEGACELRIGEKKITSQEEDILKIQNPRDFVILEKSVDYGYDSQPCRRVAADVLSALDELVENKTGKALFDNYAEEEEDGSGVEPGLLAGVDYYEVEDEITGIIESFEDFDGDPVEEE